MDLNSSAGAPPIFACCDKAMDYGLGPRRPLALVARINHIKNPRIRNGAVSYTMRLSDTERGLPFTTAPVFDARLVQRARDFFDSGERVLCHGYFLGMTPPRKDGDEGEPIFHLTRLSPLPDYSALLGVTDDERAEAARVAETFFQPGTDPTLLEEYLLSEARQILRIEPGVLSPRYRLAERATLLQALSHAMVGPATNPRLSLFLFSDPGRGKKPLSLMAALFAPLSQTVQPTLCTPAGVGASVRMSKDGPVCEPGVLPQCSLGTVVFEDMHRLNKTYLFILQALLMSTAEDGRLTPVKMASASYSAKTALHINSNLQSILTAALDLYGPQARAQLLCLPWDLLTRIDLLMKLDAGDDAEGGAKEMVHAAHGPLSEEEEAELAARTRRLKVLIAHLIDRAPVVSLEQVGPELDALVENISAVLRSDTARLTGLAHQGFEGDSQLRRMANTIKKLVAASARLRGRTEATAEDVKCAEEMVNLKLEVLRWLCSDEARIIYQGTLKEQAERARREEEARFAVYLERFGGQTVTAAQLADELGFTDRTVRRDLRKRGIRPEQGRYTLPELEDYHREEQERRWRQEREEQAAAPAGPAAPLRSAQDGREGPICCESDEREGSPSDPASLLAQARAARTQRVEGPEVDEEGSPGEFDPGDHLKALPKYYNPLLEAIDAQDEERMGLLAEELERLIHIEEVDPLHWLTLCSTFDELAFQGLPPGAAQVAEELKRELSSPEWARRAHAALRLYLCTDVHQHGFPRYLFQDAERNPALPPSVRADLEAARRRLELCRQGKLRWPL